MNAKVPAKRKLSYDEQIEKMAKDGIKFSITNEEDSKEFLQYNNYFFKLKSYTKNYKRNGDGKYSGLEFAYIVELSVLDTHFRSAVLDLCLSVEHQLKVMLMRAITNDPNEDGYSIIQELFDKYPYIKENLEKKKQSATRDLWLHNRDSLSVWCFMEMCSYDSFIKLFIHYFEKDPPGKPDDLDGLIRMLISSKFLRNAAAHNNCLLNSLRQSYTYDGDQFKPSKSVTNELRALVNLPRKVVKRNLENHIVHDFVSTLLVFKRVCTSKIMFENVMGDIEELFSKRFLRHKEYFENDTMLVSRYRFTVKVIDTIRKAI